MVDLLTQKYKLNEESTLLDVGCAKGYLVWDYEKRENLGSAIGIDISLYALLKGKKNFLLTTFMRQRM